MAEKIYSIEGGRPIQGSVVIGGAKNAISKQLIASILTDQPSVFTNVPRITEIEVLLDMLTEIGTRYEWLDQNTLGLQTPSIINDTVSQKYSGVNRVPILLLAPLLHRAGQVTVPVVGGCRIGARPVDFHIDALRQMGAEIEYGAERYIARCSRLRGKTIHLAYPSVGATESIIIAGVLAEGTTVITNAAVEPEITDTILFLQKMGALIQVDVDRRIIIEGVKRLDGATHHTITDRIEAASFAAAAVACNGRVKIVNAQQEHMITFLNELRKAGGGFTVEKDGIVFFRYQPQLSATHLETDVHPGFMTDWQQPFIVLLTQAHGVSIVHETVYEDRFGYTRVLAPMGASIDVTRGCLGRKPCRFADQDHFHSCIVRGPSPLRGKDMVIPDLRAGFANIIAALVADGVSNISGVRYIERGYAHVAEKLASIGAAIEVREQIPAPVREPEPLVKKPSH